MGRVKKYDNADEAKQAQKEQIRKSNQKYQAERREFKKAAYNEQLELVKLLNKHVIRDKEFLAGTLQIVQEYVEDNIEGAGETLDDTLVNDKGETQKDLDVILEDKKESGVEEVIDADEEKEKEKEKEKEREKELKPKRKYVRKTPAKPKKEKEVEKELKRVD
jgi:septum formation inhibitor MinC